MSESDGPAKRRDAAVADAVPTEDELEDFRTLLDRTRLIIVQQTLAHDSGVLCRAELAARNPDVNESTLQYHLDTLVVRGLLTKETPSETKRDLPSVFYAVSKRGIDLLKQLNLHDEIAVWNDLYSSISTPDELRQIEAMDRPEPEWYDY
ncbi:helix-turn-helix domain-containing protein [Halosimplex carlsbadense]|uniref:helix-turn-helix transcriptional regulator n=1 Tax=Halosimplex carlsbadense TaxID=171164 RepID=UPI0012684678|nr:helix-turn-helix transcriptional regulator [Halosimplex carlsbadense]